MQFIARIFVVIALLAVELAAVYAVLHPHVTPEYRAYYINQTTTDWKSIHYRASLEDGITFNRPGWPEFVASTSGISSQEADGRWTDAGLQPVARIQFDSMVSGPVCLAMSVMPSAAELGKDVVVGWGNENKEIQLAKPGFSEYQLGFEGNTPADALTFKFEGSVPRNNDVFKESLDHRRLGIKLSSLSISPGACRTAAVSATGHPN
jgi:Domain of unknown function (DUF7024)